jgi:hypothetical protein
MPSYGLGLTGTGYDHELPSGNTCRMKDADLPALIASGVVDSVDELTSLVQTDHVDRVKKGKKTRHLQPAPGAKGGLNLPPEQQAVLDIMKDKKRWGTLERVINAVVAECVLEPKVLPPPPEGQDYAPHQQAGIMAGTMTTVQQVALMDRFSIFARAMAPVMAGQAAMKPFRDGRETPVAGVATGEDVQPAAERDAGDR